MPPGPSPSRDQFEDVVIRQELDEPVDHPELRDGVDRHPRRLDCVIARDWRLVVEHHDAKVEDDEVMIRPEAFQPADELTAHTVQARLLAQLPHDGLCERLAAFDAAPRYGPLALRRTATAAHHEEPLIGEDDRADADFGSGPRAFSGHR